MHSFEALVFDFGNVLIDLDIEGWELNIRSLIDPIYQGRGVESYLKDLFIQIEKGEITENEWIIGISQYTRAGIGQEEIIRIWNSILIGIQEEVFELLVKLRSTYQVYLLSNTNVLHMDWVYDHLRAVHGVTDWDEYFDRTYYSHLMGMRKPDSEIYERVLRESELDPRSTLFFDDNIDNIVSGQKLGIQGYLKPPQRPINQIIRRLGLLA